MTGAARDFRPFFVTAGTVRLRAGRFDAEDARGVCLLLNGQTEFIEKYFEVIDELRGRGFCVVTFDWRGQGGSDRLLPDRRKAHIEDFSAYDQDLATVMREVVNPLAAGLEASGPSPWPIRWAETSCCAGCTMWRTNSPPPFCARPCWASIRAARPGGWWKRSPVNSTARRLPRIFVWGMADRDQLKLPFAQQIVTSDPARYARTQALLAADPELRLNGPTWGWLGAALDAIALTRSPGYAEAIQTPCLFFGAGRDRVCDTEAVRMFAARMPHAEFVEIADAEHEILMERDVFRAQLWSAFDAFHKKKRPSGFPLRRDFQS